LAFVGRFGRPEPEVTMNSMTSATASEVAALQAIRMELKGLLALQDEQVQALAVAVGSRAKVRVPYSVHGIPNGNYHKADGHCGKITRITYTRTFSEHDAAKLLERCRFCRW
jgi:hypothetical protein